MSKVQKHTSKVLSHVSGVPSDAEAQAFIDAHPLFGLDAKLPKTAAAIKDFTKQVRDGLITADEADEKLTPVLNAELKKHPKVEEEFNDDLMMAMFGLADAN